jgi:hypothetical protein
MHDNDTPLAPSREVAFYALLSAAKAVVEYGEPNGGSRVSRNTFNANLGELRTAVAEAERALRSEK